MEIGVPKETKDQEFRVGLSPSSVRVLHENGHTIFVETEAGTGLALPIQITSKPGRRSFPLQKLLGIEN